MSIQSNNNQYRIDTTNIKNRTKEEGIFLQNVKPETLKKCLYILKDSTILSVEKMAILLGHVKGKDHEIWESKKQQQFSAWVKTNYISHKFGFQSEFETKTTNKVEYLIYIMKHRQETLEKTEVTLFVKLDSTNTNKKSESNSNAKIEESESKMTKLIENYENSGPYIDDILEMFETCNQEELLYIVTHCQVNHRKLVIYLIEKLGNRFPKNKLLKTYNRLTIDHPVFNIFARTVNIMLDEYPKKYKLLSACTDEQLDYIVFNKNEHCNYSLIFFLFFGNRLSLNAVSKLYSLLLLEDKQQLFLRSCTNEQLNYIVFNNNEIRNCSVRLVQRFGRRLSLDAVDKLYSLVFSEDEQQQFLKACTDKQLKHLDQNAIIPIFLFKTVENVK